MHSKINVSSAVLIEFIPQLIRRSHLFSWCQHWCRDSNMRIYVKGPARKNVNWLASPVSLSNGNLENRTQIQLNLYIWCHMIPECNSVPTCAHSKPYQPLQELPTHLSKPPPCIENHVKHLMTCQDTSDWISRAAPWWYKAMEFLWEREPSSQSQKQYLGCS